MFFSILPRSYCFVNETRCRCREPTIASAPGVGRSTLPVYLQSARRQGMVGFSEDQRSPPGPVNRPPPRRKGTNASSGHQGPSPGSVNRPPARKNGAVASSGAVGLSAGPDDRPPSRKQGIPDPSGTFGQSANPVDRPTVRQGKVPKKSTTSRRPLHCTRGTISSQSRYVCYKLQVKGWSRSRGDGLFGFERCRAG